MTSGAARRLTDRQRAVMERIDRRVPIKVIAQDLGVSETRINQHIRALKNLYEAGSLGELVENYRALSLEMIDVLDEIDLSNTADTGLHKPLSEAAYRNSQINPATVPAELGRQDDPGHLVLSDSMPLFQQAPWLSQGEPKVVPGVLDGEHAALLRLGAIVTIASGILAGAILAGLAAKTLSEATDGKATYSAEIGVEAG